MAVTRQWQARIFQGDYVVLRQFLVLAPGEEATDDPPTVTLPWAQWLTDHDTTYGLTIDGRPTGDDATLRAAINKLKATAALAPATSATAGDIKAVLRIFKEINAALADGP